MYRLFSLIVMSIAISCNSPKQDSDVQDIDDFFARYLWNTTKHYPEKLTEIGIYVESSSFKFNSMLNNESDSFKLSMFSVSQKYLDSLGLFDRSALTESQRISADILEWNLKNKVEGKKYMYNNYLVNQMTGRNITFLTFMSETHTIEDIQDTKNYISRLSASGEMFDQVLAGMKTRASKGVVPPKFIIAKSIQQMSDFIKGESKTNLLYSSLEERLEPLDIPNDQKEKLLISAETEISNSVIPAYQSLIAYYEQLDSTATEDIGVWKMPDGDAFYTYIMQKHTSVAMTPEEVHELGLKEADRLLDEMSALLDSAGYHGDSLYKQFTALWDNVNWKGDRFRYNDTSEVGRQQVLADYNSIVERTRNEITHLFDILPNARLTIKPIAAALAGSSPGHYEPQSYDGTRPGTFFVNLVYLPYKPGMANLVYHEGIPGHHYQVALHRERTDQPRFRTEVYYPGYHEGWAVYAQRLCYDNGLFSDIYSKLNYLNSELWRAVRLIVDTGVHMKRWSREEALLEMAEISGRGSEREVDRYTVFPGQACGYMLGYLKIRNLREKAKNELGEKFNIKEFHNVILENGSMPLDITERMVDKYIEEKKNS